VNLAESIGSRLTYFNELEVISKVFDTPGEVVVLSEPFVPMLARLDECLEYVQSHVRATPSFFSSLWSPTFLGGSELIIFFF